MERTGVDRRPGMKIPVEKPIRAFRFAYLAKAGKVNESLMYSSSMLFATFIAAAFLYAVDGYFFDGYYGNAAWKVFQQIYEAFRF